MIINATWDNQTIATSVTLLPGSEFGENYSRMVENVPYFWSGFKNSLIISGIGTIISAYFGALTAFAFAKYKFKFKEALFWVVLTTMMVPPQLGIIGFFDLINKIGLINSPLALILPMAANANLVFFVRGYIASAVPTSVMESARIDGCGEYKIFNKIIIPMIVPSIATMSIFTFISTWNNFLTPLIVLYDEKKYTVPLMTAMAKGVYRTDFGAVYVTIALAVVPIMIVFAFCSKYIIGGLAAGAVKE
jgi:multiple sugar transport system permease protein